MTIIFICLLILFLIYIIKGRSKIEFYIQTILKNKMVYINNIKSMKNNNNKNLINNKGNKNIKNNQNLKKFQSKKILINKKKKTY